MSSVASQPPDGQPQTWVSVPAVAWVLDSAPDMPASLVSTLLAFARRANHEGRRSYPSLASVADMTRKSVRQVKRDVVELLKLGLLVPGDPQVVAHLSADRRPNVYDLPLWLKRGVMDDTPRGDTDDTPSTDSKIPRGDMDDRTGCHTGSDGVSPTSPKEDKNNPIRKEDSLRESSSSATPPAQRPKTPEEDEDARTKKIAAKKQRTRAKALRKVIDRAGVDAELADALLDYLVDNYAAGDLAAYVDSLDDDDLQKNLDDATWQIEADRATEREYARLADELIANMKKFPTMGADLAADLKQAYITARRNGHDEDAIYAAVNTIYPSVTKPSYAFVDVIDDLSREPAA